MKILKEEKIVPPACLFHYTSVDTLALILQNKTIRFNPLYKMDDPLEQWSKHGVQEGHFVFISSWSDCAEEDMDMWSNYCKTGLEGGVRISLQSNPFSWEDNQANGMIVAIRKMDRLNKNYLYRHHVDNVDQMLPDEIKNVLTHMLQNNPQDGQKMENRKKQIMRETVIGYPVDSSYGRQAWDDLLMQVEYTDENDKIFPWMYSKYQGAYVNDYSKYGRFKTTSWKWQSEWRYRLHFKMASTGVMRNDKMMLYPLPFEYYDLKLSNNALEKIRITLSPQISDENRMKVCR